MAARKRVGLSENTRKRIQASMIVNRLTDHIVGKVEMQQTQVTAALGLLRKVLPDLQAVDMSLEDNSGYATMATAALEARAREIIGISGTGRNTLDS